MSSSLPRPTRTHVAIALVALTTAFAVTLQLRTERETRRVLGVPSPRLAELAYTMQREEQHRTALEGEVTSLRQHLATLADAAATDQQGLRRMNDDLSPPEQHTPRPLAVSEPLTHDRVTSQVLP